MQQLFSYMPGELTSYSSLFKTEEILLDKRRLNGHQMVYWLQKEHTRTTHTCSSKWFKECQAYQTTQVNNSLHVYPLVF